MKKTLAIVTMCCTFVLTMGLAACGGSSSGGANSNSSDAPSDEGSSASASTAPAETASADVQLGDIPAEYLDIDGGITLNAVQGLTGPELTALLKQQGYEWDILGWENTTTGDRVAARNAAGDTVKEAGFASATGKGELAEGYVKIVTDARSIITTDDLVTVRDALAQGFTIEDSWLTGGGAFLYNVVTDPAGERGILIVIADAENEATVEFSTDAYLVATDQGGVDGVIELWKS